MIKIYIEIIYLLEMNSLIVRQLKAFSDPKKVKRWPLSRLENVGVKKQNPLKVLK